MTSSLKSSLGVFLTFAGLFALSGCLLPQAQSDPTRYFVLSAEVAKPEENTTAPAKHWRLGLRGVEVPAFLRNRSMVVRVADSEVRLNDEARWAEPLEAGVGRVLRESLEARADVTSVTQVAAGSELPRDFDVVVRVLRCEGAKDTGVARFVATVEIYSVGDPMFRVARQTFTTEVPGWNGGDFRDLAHKLSSAVNQLAGQTVGLLDGVHTQAP